MLPPGRWCSVTAAPRCGCAQRGGLRRARGLPAGSLLPLGRLPASPLQIPWLNPATAPESRLGLGITGGIRDFAFSWTLPVWQAPRGGCRGQRASPSTPDSGILPSEPASPDPHRSLPKPDSKPAA